MTIRKRFIVRVASGTAALLLLVAGLFAVPHASAGQFDSRGLQLGDSAMGLMTSYRFFFTGVTTTDIGSIRLQLCSNDPFPETPCTPPTGLDFTGSTLSDQGGMIGFTVDPSSTVNEVLLTRVPAPGLTTPSYYEFTDVVNPDTPGSYYARITSYASTDGSGPALDYGGIAIDIDPPGGLMVETEVPPFLLFCVGNTITASDCATATGNYIDFGEFASTTTATGRTEMVVATNAADGFIITVLGTTLTSGTNTINKLATADVSRRGVSQFGLNLRANASPPGGQNPSGYGLSAVVSSKYNQPNYYAFNSGDILVSATDPDFMKYVASYIVNVSTNQAPGVYVSTLQYIALASF